MVALRILTLCLAVMASARGAVVDIAVPEATCVDGAPYTSELGPSPLPQCTIAKLDGVTSDACGRACAEHPDCWCATHDQGGCAVLAEACCTADVMRPCRSSLTEQSTMLSYVKGGVTGRATTTR